MSRIVVAGWPRCGKTTLAKKLADAHGWPVHHLDDLAHLGWSEASAAAVELLAMPGPWIVEGVAAGRALRKWRALRGEVVPVDAVYYLSSPYATLTDGQRRMGLGCDTVWREIAGWLREGFASKPRRSADF